MDVSVWLTQLGLGQHADVFRENAITADVLASLKDEHLRELGLPLGHRLKLLDAIAALGSTAERAGGAGHGEEWAASPAVSRPERRQIAVLFADLAGYTRLATALDAEEVHSLLQAFFTQADRIVTVHGGQAYRR